jgi:hypothetical protein
MTRHLLLLERQPKLALAVALVIAFSAGCVGGPAASPTPSPSPTPTSARTESPSPSPSPTTVPSPVLSNWTGIEWSDPVAPFTSRSFYFNDIMPWDSGFVGAGGFSESFQCEEASLFRSADGMNWTVSDRFSSGDEFSFYMCPDFVVATPDGLLALGQRRTWSSDDGAHWTEIESPTWRALWTSELPQMLGVAAGPEGVVAIGMSLDTSEAIVAHSDNGTVWKRVDLPATEQPIVRDVASYAGGFVIVGRDGQPDGEASPSHPAIVPGVGRPAAWLSSDGVSWTAAAVEGDRVQGATLAQVLIGSGGLFAVGINRPTDWYPLGQYDAGAVVAAWASTDGTSWESAGALGADLPPMGLLASDGTTMVGLAGPTAWSSADGLNWTELAVSGPALDVSYLVLEPQLRDNPSDTELWVLPDGLLARGAGDGVPTNEPYARQWLRLATATVR